jgi:hypothetical protein
MTVALGTTGLFLLYRYGYMNLPFDAATTFALTDKWHLGALRVVNFAALAYVVNAWVLPVFAWLRVTVLSMLGRASLEVFTAHVPFCVLSRALLVDDATPLPLVTALWVLGATFGAMFFVAWRTGLVRAPRSGPSRWPRARPAPRAAFPALVPAPARTTPSRVIRSKLPARR